MNQADPAKDATATVIVRRITPIDSLSMSQEGWDMLARALVVNNKELWDRDPERGRGAVLQERAITAEEVRMARYQLAVLFALAGLKQSKQGEESGMIENHGLPDHYNPEVRVEGEAWEPDQCIDLARCQKGREEIELWQEEFVSNRYMGEDGTLNKKQFKLDQQRLFGKQICKDGSADNMLRLILGNADTARAAKFYNTLSILYSGMRIEEVIAQDPDRELIDHGRFKRNPRPPRIKPLVAAASPVVLPNDASPFLLPNGAKIDLCQKSAVDILSEVFSDDPPRELFVSANELNEIVERSDLKEALFQVKNLMSLCLHPAASRSVAYYYGLTAGDMEGYLFKNVERLRSCVGSRAGVVRLTHMPLRRGFFFDVDNKAKQSYISNAWIGDFACDCPFLAFPGGEGGVAHALWGKSLTLWQRGEDIVDYGKPQSVLTT